MLRRRPVAQMKALLLLFNMDVLPFHEARVAIDLFKLQDRASKRQLTHPCVLCPQQNTAMASAGPYRLVQSLYPVNRVELWLK